MAGYDQFNPSLNQSVNNSLLSKVGVDGHHREALPEAGLGGHQPLHPSVSKQAKVLLWLLPKSAQAATKIVCHGVNLDR